MRPAASHAQLRTWIGDHLDPLEDSPEAWRGGPIDDGWLEEPEKLNRPAAVLIGLVEREEGLSVILTRRADHLRKHNGQIALPGGGRDPGETPVATALREAREEIGLDPALVTPVGLSTPYRSRFHVIIPVVGLVAPGFELEPDPTEVAAIFEAPFGFLMDAANYAVRDGMTPAGDIRRYYETRHGDWHIWGVTAGILHTLHSRLLGDPVA